MSISHVFVQISPFAREGVRLRQPKQSDLSLHPVGPVMGNSSKLTDRDLVWVDEWNRIVSENAKMVGPPPYDSAISEARNTRDIVKRSLAAQQTSRSTPEQLFLAAVAHAQTHPDLASVESSAYLKVPRVVSSHVAIILRYAEAIDKSLESLGNVAFPAAVLFAFVRFMMWCAIKDINLLIAMESQFEQVSLRLQRLDVYLALESPNEATKSMLRKVMIDILRFCSLSIVYLKCTPTFCQRLL